MDEDDFEDEETESEFAEMNEKLLYLLKLK